MKDTSSLFARGTPSEAYAEDTSGTPPIEEKSATTSEGFTEWAIQMVNGDKYIVKIPGDGRISYGRSSSRDGGDVRFYRNQTTKTYDAVIPNVAMVFSNRVTIEKAAPTEAEANLERVREEIRAVREKRQAETALKELTEAIVRREYAEAEEPSF